MTRNLIIYRDWSLFAAIDALKAYDHGGTDSGVRDADMKEAVRRHLNALSTEDEQTTLTAFADEYFLCDKAREQGYSEEDAEAFWEWARDEFGSLPPPAAEQHRGHEGDGLKGGTGQ